MFVLFEVTCLYVTIWHRRPSKGVDYLVEASAAEAEAITAALAAAKAKQNGEAELPDRDRGAEATPSGKQISTLIKPDSALSTPAGVRLHHRAVCILNPVIMTQHSTTLILNWFICAIYISR